LYNYNEFQAADLKLFKNPFKWVLYGDFTTLSNYYFGVDSQVYVIHKGDSDSYTVKSIYKYSPNSSFVQNDVAIWSTNGSFSRNKTSAISNRKNLMGTTIKISYVITNLNSLNHLWDYRNNHIDAISKLNYILVHHLMDFLNASKEFIMQRTWGYKNASTGLYSGMAGDLQRGLADLGGTPLFFTIDRIDIIDYIAATTSTYMRFIFRAPPLSYVTNVFTLPFDATVWHCSFVMVGVVVVAIYIIVVWEWKNQRFREKFLEAHTTALKPNFFDVIMLEIGAISQQGTDVEPKSNAGRIATILTFLTLMFMYTSYSANIVALLQSTTDSIRTLEDLLNSRIKLGVEDIVYAHYYFENAQEPVRKAIYQQKVAPKGQKPNFMTAEEGMKRVQQGFFAFHVELNTGYKIVSDIFQENEKCGLMEVEYVNLIEPWLSTRKNSAYKEVMKIGMKKMKESGIQNREMKKIYTRKPICHGKGSNFDSVGMIDCYSAFLIFGTTSTLNISEITDVIQILGRLYDFDYHASERTSIEKLHKSFELSEIDIITTMKFLTTPCEDLLLECSWKGVPVKCSKIFRLSLTSEGYCCTFNYVKKSSPLLGDGTPVKGTDGITKGLSVIINNDVEDYQYVPLLSTGVIVRVFNPTVFPDKSSGSLSEVLAPASTENFLEIVPTTIRTVSEVGKYPLSKRQCLFDNEKPKKFKGLYSQSDCNMECRIASSLALCQCIPFMIPKSTPETVCDLTNLACLNRYRNKWNSLYPEKDDYGQLQRERHDSLRCNEICYPSCDGTSYEILTDTAPVRTANLTQQDPRLMMTYIQFVGQLYDFDFKQESIKNLLQFQKILDLAGLTIINLVKTLTIPCNELLNSCTWQRVRINCSEIFLMRLTYEGYCCVFNYIKEIPNERTTEKMPLTTESGLENGLSVEITNKVDDYFYSTLSSVGVTAHVFFANDYPDKVSGSLNEILIESKSENFLEIVPTTVKAVKDVLHYPVPERECLFDTERRTVVGKAYSQSDCYVECRLESILALCKCVPFKMPVSNDNTVCTLEDIPCLNRYRDK
ncbi:glutamate receptor 2, partial [Asbolus verrucosus]